MAGGDCSQLVEQCTDVLMPNSLNEKQKGGTGECLQLEGLTRLQNEAHLGNRRKL